MNNSIEAAACAVDAAGFTLFTAGAGMGVDSGLPDVRGNEGFWRAYPPLAQLGIGFDGNQSSFGAACNALITAPNAGLGCNWRSNKSG